MSKIVFFVAVTFIALNLNCEASTSGRELDYAQLIDYERNNLKGDVVWLQQNGKKFLALYTETEKLENKGTAIILHSMGGHPDHNSFSGAVRRYLPQHNWATLSIQLPVLSVRANPSDYLPLLAEANARIKASVDYLKDAEVKHIVLIGYQLGAIMALNYLNQQRDNNDVKAVVTMSLNVLDAGQHKINVIKFIKEVNRPMLDIFSENDQANVVHSARKRRMAGKSNPQYRQFKIQSQGYRLDQDENLLVKRIYSWMNKVFKQIE